jgi:bacillithiol synthase
LDTDCLPFIEIPGTSRLFLDFLQRQPEIQSFYPASPHSIEQLATFARTVHRSSRLSQVAEVLKRQNQSWNASAATLTNIERLAQGACAVVSGQQVGILLGPAYTLYKAITAIRLAQDLCNRGVDAVPIFWMASEDHDLVEVNHVILPDDDGGLQRLHTYSSSADQIPVGEITLNSDVTQLLDQLAAPVDNSEIIRILRDAYVPGASFSTAFAQTMSRIFGKYGLILLDPSDPALHRIAQPIYESAAVQSEELTGALLARSKELEAAGYHVQVKVTNSSTQLFFRNGNARQAVQRKNGHFAANGKQWSAEQLWQQIAETPELFSPNALLRPVVQDFLLPTAAYVAGPAEIAYFAQSNVIYQRLLGHSTAIWPRFSATLVEPRIGDWMRKYGLGLRDVLLPKEDFTAALARRTIPADLKEDFDRSREQLDKLLRPLQLSLGHLDPTIAAAAEVAGRKMRYQLERLESRAARAHLRREDGLERQAGLISSSLFPNRELQERQIAGVYFLAKHGIELIDRLIAQVRPECSYHQIVRL